MFGIIYQKQGKHVESLANINEIQANNPTILNTRGVIFKRQANMMNH